MANHTRPPSDRRSLSVPSKPDPERAMAMVGPKEIDLAALERELARR